MSAPNARFLVDGPEDAPATLVLAHGAGAPMDSAFMNTLAAGVAASGARVVRFEFPYMEARRKQGSAAARPIPSPSFGRDGWM